MIKFTIQNLFKEISIISNNLKHIRYDLTYLPFASLVLQRGWTTPSAHPWKFMIIGTRNSTRKTKHAKRIGALVKNM